MKIQDAIDLCAEVLKTHQAQGKNFVGKKISPLELREKVDFSIPENPLPSSRLREDMKNYLEFTPNTTTPYFQNQLFSGLNPYALIGDWFSSYTNTTMATFEVAPFGTLAEKELVEHFNKKISWQSGDGIMVTGGSNANFVAMLVARNNLYPETKKNGVQGLRLVAFVSEDAHYSFDKGVNMLGLGLSSLKKVPTDKNGKMISSELRRLILLALESGETPFFIGATAGTTVLGAFDPIQEIAKIARDFKLWLHVDGAWGGCVLFSSKHRKLMAGIELADSLALDTHKMLGTGLVSSFFLTRHSGSLRASNDSGGGEYIFHESEEGSFDTGPSSLQCGRRVDAFKVWLMWRSLGDSGVEALIDKLFTNAAIAKKLILDSTELELLHWPEMLNLCFRYTDDELHTKASREMLLTRGKLFVNIATRKEKTFFRLVLVNPALDQAIIQETIQEIIQSGVKL